VKFFFFFFPEGVGRQLKRKRLGGRERRRGRRLGSLPTLEGGGHTVLL
jgi:hypothetical protein